MLEPVEIITVKATEKNPFAKTNLSKEQIKKSNIGQDLPFILSNTVSVVANSDAGNGVGYTGIRLRGSDATRINVTLNGIPYNDAESLGTFFVDMPDVASSAGSIQIQRGVGTSANGAGSFGGSINISTNEINKAKKIELNNVAGSFGTLKNSLLFNSGIFKKHFLIDASLSRISSNGFIDRAFAKLKSFYFSSAYLDKKNSLRFNVFGGKEKTYQAWYGVNENLLGSNRSYNIAGTEKQDSPYENETDNYTQTHYQLFYNHKYNNYLKYNIALFLTRGNGYYEQYKADQKLTKYGISNFGSSATDNLIRKLWLDNYFYGTIFSLQYDKRKTHIIVGGGYNNYDGKHFGTLNLLNPIFDFTKNYKWYNKTSSKKDASLYTKWSYSFSNYFETFVDVQVRNVQYTNDGYRNNPNLTINKNFNFLNPKIGFTFYKANYKIYASYGKAVKEPNRDDFETSIHSQPLPEKLHDIETGIEYKKDKRTLGVNFYYMFYSNQLVLTGSINDVGAYNRTNIAKSYRAGIELFGTAQLSKKFTINGNCTFSKNKVKNFTVYGDDYDNGGQFSTFYKEADISFSPNLISSLSLYIKPLKNTEIIINSKYVGKQFLDNTSNNNRKLKDYYTQDIRVGYNLFGKKIKEVNLFLQANNVFSKLYETNGYTFSYIYGGTLNTENYYFPMAPINILVGVNLKL